MKERRVIFYLQWVSKPRQHFQSTIEHRPPACFQQDTTPHNHTLRQLRFLPRRPEPATFFDRAGCRSSRVLANKKEGFIIYFFLGSIRGIWVDGIRLSLYRWLLGTSSWKQSIEETRLGWGYLYRWYLRLCIGRQKQRR